MMAFGAFWFASEVAKRTEKRGQLAMKPHMEPVNAALQKADTKIRNLTKGLENAEREIAHLRAQLSDHGNAPGKAKTSAFPGDDGTDASTWVKDPTFRPSEALHA
jgi:septal ring factor EnvC (AmiA/AmiB activator)